MVSIMNAKNVWDSLKYDNIIVQLIQQCKSWMKYHNYCANGTKLSILNVNIMCDWGNKWHQYCTSRTMVSIRNELSLLMYKWFNGVDHECQKCVGFVKKWQHCCTIGTMVSTLNELSLLLYKWNDGVNRECQ